MLDQLSGGRLMPGVGRGVQEIEHAWFGLDPQSARERFDEALELSGRACGTRRLVRRARHPFDDDRLALRAAAAAASPLWYAGNLEVAAALGMSVDRRRRARCYA